MMGAGTAAICARTPNKSNRHKVTPATNPANSMPKLIEEVSRPQAALAGSPAVPPAWHLPPTSRNPWRFLVPPGDQHHGPSRQAVRHGLGKSLGIGGLQ